MPRLKKCLFVLGCGRSGTSMLTKMLSENGYQLPEINSSNWEDKRIRRINDLIIDGEGKHWFDVDKPISNIRTPEILHGIEEVIEDYQRFDNPVIKCPRMIFCLPVWLRFVESPSFIGILRDIDQVCDSLARKYPNMPLTTWQECWRNYNIQLWEYVLEYKFPVIDLNNPLFLSEAQTVFTRSLGVKDFKGSAYSEQKVSCNVRKLEVPDVNL